jgi:hypothetical protein
MFAPAAVQTQTQNQTLQQPDDDDATEQDIEEKDTNSKHKTHPDARKRAKMTTNASTFGAIPHNTEGLGEPSAIIRVLSRTNQTDSDRVLINASRLADRRQEKTSASSPSKPAVAVAVDVDVDVDATSRVVDATAPGQNEPGTSPPKCRPDSPDPWPFEKINAYLHTGTEKFAGNWPAAGWRQMSLDNPEFRGNFRFYIYDEAPFHMQKAEACLRAMYHLPPEDTPASEAPKFDHQLGLVQRLYLPELSIWPVLRKHPMRTMNPEDAHVYVIGYSPLLAHQLRRREGVRECEGLPEYNEWEEQVCVV